MWKIFYILCVSVGMEKTLPTVVKATVTVNVLGWKRIRQIPFLLQWNYGWIEILHMHIKLALPQARRRGVLRVCGAARRPARRRAGFPVLVQGPAVGADRRIDRGGEGKAGAGHQAGA